MAVFFIFTFIFLFTFSPTALAHRSSPVADKSKKGLQTYIVHVEQPEAKVFSETQDLETWYKSFLPVTIADVGGPKRLVYSYRNVVSGFAARLTELEVKAMEAKNGFVSARPARTLKLMTTHTPNFLGLYPQLGFWKDSNFGRGMIIGVLDTGVLPSHPSFSGKGMPPPPAKWKGKCEFNTSERCNNKIIGARTFISESGPRVPPFDADGHGSHTASTAAGSFVKGASALGNAAGTAVGIAPYAHLAIYKVCLIEDCLEVDLLAGLDTAVEDGVDIISLSIGGKSIPFFEDGIAIGSFGAMQKGILVSCAAGNAGPFKSTLSNEAPWILTVGASTIDRTITASAKLGNGEVFDGESLFQPKNFPSTLLPVVYAGANGNRKSAFCAEGSLSGTDVKGKVVLCELGGGIARIDKGVEVKRAGGAAMILMNGDADAFSTSADAHVLPATHVSFADGLKIMAYINSSLTPMATIVFKGTVIGLSTAPKVTSYSSRGPSLASPGILKPDIVGPGDSILAAWPFSVNNSTGSKSTFNIISGTSMSTPHVAGIATLLKSAHPDWSPAAIKSAMMTTADLLSLERRPIVDQTLHTADLFAIGAGHVNPSKANNPGLVYDIHPEDYIPYLCGLGYTSTQVGMLARRHITCSNETSIPEGELNYPSFSVTLGRSKRFTRTVTNVGEAHSTYEVQIAGPQGVDVIVTPDKLYFTKMNQKLTYSVTFTKDISYGQFSKGFLTWVSPKYSVRSPISVTFENV